jgi:hypothetical protein
MTLLTGYYLNTNPIANGNFLKDVSNFLRISDIDGYASGGTVDYCGNDKYHKFTSNGQFITSIPLNTELLIVGGGGKGGNYPYNLGGGGGGGGQIKHLYQTLLPGTYNASIGSGSQQSSFYNIIALPGQDGSAYQSGASGSGFAGGANLADVTGGGGGGDTSIGKDGTYTKGGDGGFGQQLPITCSNIRYGGGGGGGSYYGSGHGNDGGGEGGHTSGQPPITIQPTAGTANTGGGGGGGSYSNGASGGSGVVVVRYQYIDGSTYIPPVNPSIGYWTYDKWSFENTLLADSSSLQNIIWDVSRGSVSYDTGKVGDAIYSDPSTLLHGYYLFKDTLIVPSTWSISFWLYYQKDPTIKIHETNSKFYGYFSTSLEGNYINDSRIVLFQDPSSDTHYTTPHDNWLCLSAEQVYSGGGISSTFESGKASLVNNTWYHIALTFNSISDIRLYVNKVYKGSYNPQIEIPGFNLTPKGLMLGGRPLSIISEAYYSNFYGKIDQFYYYPNYVLTVADVSTLYNGGSGV